MYDCNFIILMEFIPLCCDMFILAYIIHTIVHNKLLIISSVNAACFSPCGPSSGTKVHDLKNK